MVLREPVSNLGLRFLALAFLARGFGGETQRNEVPLQWAAWPRGILSYKLGPNLECTAFAGAELVGLEEGDESLTVTKSLHVPFITDRE
jgi:hypothetical protein